MLLRRTALPSLSFAILLSVALLASCGGATSEIDPADQNPASGIFSGADSFGNPSSVLITPDGSFVSVTSTASLPASVLSVSTAIGGLTPLVFTSPRVATQDLVTGALPLGTLLVNYQQSVRTLVDLSYSFGTRSITANFLPYSFSSDASIRVPSAATAALYVPRPSGPHQLLSASWSLSLSSLVFSAVSADCTLQGQAVLHPDINAFSLSATASPGCQLGTTPLKGFLWYDSQRGTAYAVLGQPTAQAQPSVVLTIPL